MYQTSFEAQLYIAFPLRSEHTLVVQKMHDFIVHMASLLHIHYSMQAAAYNLHFEQISLNMQLDIDLMQGVWLQG